MKPIFVTLTYPEQWPEEAACWKTQLESFWKRITRRYADAACIWRLEPQERGAPHFHLIVFNTGYIMKDNLKQWWYDVVNSGDEKHLTQGVYVEQCRDWVHAGSYVSKYIAKKDPRILALPWGRMWGVKGGANLPFNVVAVRLSEPEYYQLRRQMRSYLEHRLHRKCRLKGRSGLWVFLPFQVLLPMATAVFEAPDDLMCCQFTKQVEQASYNVATAKSQAVHRRNIHYKHGEGYL